MKSQHGNWAVRVALTILAMFVNPALASDNGSFSAFSSGCNGPVYAVELLSNGDTVVGGTFTSCGGVSVNHVARWDGSAWNALGGGTNGGVYALETVGNSLYVGGLFSVVDTSTAAYNVASWNSSTATWSDVGSSAAPSPNSGEVRALAYAGGLLYAGGAFAAIGSTSANYIASWNGTSWSALGTGSFNGTQLPVNALAAYGSSVYLGGEFYFVWSPTGGSWYSSTHAYNVALWDGTQFSSLDLGVYMSSGGASTVRALANSGSTLYVGGVFNVAGVASPTSVLNVAAYDHAGNWSALGAGLNSTVRALIVSPAGIFAGGDFTASSSTTLNYISEWNSGAWQRLEHGCAIGTNNSVFSLGARMVGLTPALVAGGSFSTAGYQSIVRIAQWIGVAPSPPIC